MQKKACLVWAVTVVGTLFSPLGNAASISPTWKLILALTGGAAFSADIGQSKNFPANSSIFSYYDYAVHQATETTYIFGGVIGAEFILSDPWSLQVGIAYYAPGAFNAQGIVTQGVDVASENQYSYNYAIQSQQLLVENKLLYRIKRYHPYLLIGIGAAWNNSKKFGVDIEPPFTTFSNQFSSNTVTSFSYDVGLGVDVDLTKNLRLGAGYRFSDFGAAKTGKGVINETITNNVLSQSHLYAQEGLIQITLLF